MALVGYYVGIYLLLYLSRTREYLADAFSANRIEPRHLASALIKIAYGIVPSRTPTRRARTSSFRIRPALWRSISAPCWA